MPNWVQNNLKLNASDEEMQNILEAIRDDEKGIGSIDFNKITPMPESLKIESGSNTDKGLRMVKAFLESLPEDIANQEGFYDEIIEYLHDRGKDLSEEDKKIWELGVKAADNINRYDAPTWYEWAYKNWGTKWNACHCSYNKEDKTLNFQTAQRAPLPVILKLSAAAPGVQMNLEFADEDIGHNCGRVVFKNGDIREIYKPEEGREAFEFSAEVWNYDLSDLSLHLNIPGTKYVYTAAEDYELIELFGKPALFTSERLTPEDVPSGLNLYHLRRADEDDRFASIEPEVGVNHGGSVLTNETIDFGENGYIELKDETEPNFTGQEISIDDYVTDHFSLDESEEQSGGMNLCQ